jgi:RNA polymerase sigma factor (sigma-70 family)
MVSRVAIDPEAVFADVQGVAELYVAESARVRALVRCAVRSPDASIDDACQVAWSRLIDHHRRVRRDRARAWLVRTAVREAIRQHARQRRLVSLDGLIETGGETGSLAAPAVVEEVIEHRAQLGRLEVLSERQRRLLWLQGLGFSYAEMADRTGASERTVERQLQRAKRRLQRAVA